MLIAILLVACGGEPPVVPAPAVLRVEDGVVARIDADLGAVEAWAADHAAHAGARLQWLDDDGDWHEVMGPAGVAVAEGTAYLVPTANLRGSPDRRFRLAAGDLRGPAVRPRPVALAVELPAPELLSADDVVAPTVRSDPGELEAIAELVGVGGTLQGWLSAACTGDVALVDCWSAEPVSRDLVAPVEADPLPAFRADHDAPGHLAVQVRLWLDAVGLDGAPTRVLAAEARTASIPSTGRRVYWGDLHAHSNLSFDGCEDPEASCGDRGDDAGEDFFDAARANALDFAALTDHAEWASYFPDGTTGPEIDVWEAQNRLAELGDGDGLVALVGYEWTNKRAKPTPVDTDYEGGHKTVLLRDLWAPETFRIGASDGTTTTTKKGASVYVQGTNAQTTSPEELVVLLDEAADVHGPTPLLTFFHHPALEKPQAVDFNHAINAPDERYERLVEVYSEHGASECVDVDAPDCDWMVNDETFRYLIRGSVQYALGMGYQLGFTAGTDCHDGRPGSIADGPSTHGDPGAGTGGPLNEQFGPGGITGVLVSGPLDRSALFDALSDRSTLATSGPRPDARALATAADGRAWLPGAVLPRSVAEVTVTAVVAAEDGQTVLRTTLLEGGGAEVATEQGGRLVATVPVAGGGSWYLRVVIEDADGAEQRVWLSPWFAEAP